MPFTAEPIQLSAEERAELEEITKSRTLPAGDVFRARLILLLAEGLPYRTIEKRLDTTAPTIARWRSRFVQQRVAGLLETRHPGQQPSVITPTLQARVLAATRRKPSDGSTHLVLPEIGSTPEHQQRRCTAHLAESRSEATSPGTLYGER